MKIIKPSQLSLISRPFREHGREWLGIGVVSLLDMTGEPQLCSEMELWGQVERDLRGEVLDAGLPKAWPEYLVAGRAWSCHGDGAGRCLVELRVANRLKRLQISGERHWQGGRATAAADFEAVSLDWAHTYGGPELAENPAGIGMMVTREAGDGRRVPLPQIEYPDQPLRSPHQAGVPAGLLPLPASHPLRQQRYGSPDRHWLERNYPGYPADMDRGGFNVAPLDQQWPERVDALDGATFSLSHLHPTLARWEGRLPVLVARAWLGRREQVEAERLTLKLTTVWFFPGSQRLAMVFHGRAGLRCFDAADVDHLLLALEASGQPRDEAYYLDFLRQRLVPGHVPDPWVADDALVPGTMLRPASEAAQPLRRGELRQRHQQVAARDAAGKAAQALLRHPSHTEGISVPKAPELERELVSGADSRASLQLESEALQAEAARQRPRVEAERDRLLADIRHLGRDTTTLQAALERPASGPPAVDGSLHLLESAPPGLQREPLRQQIEQAGQGLCSAYRQGAQYQAPAARLSADDSMARRQALEKAFREGRSLAGWDLTGLDLTGIDLRGADLSAALMESVDFSGARLDGCDLSRSVLVRSVLQRVSLRSSRLEGTNLAGSTIEDSDLVESRWDGSVLDDALVSRCRMTGSQLRQCRLHGTRFETVDLQQASLSEMVLDRLELRNVNCQGSRIRKLAFVQCRFHEVDFSDTDISGLAMVTCQLDHLTRFARSRMVKACFVGGCEFDRPDFSSARLHETNWRGARVAGLSLFRASISASDFTDASLAGGNLGGARFEQVQMVRTDLTDANLESADLLGAYMRGACLDGACLQRANLFRANLGEVRMDSNTRFDRAYLERYCAYPLAADAPDRP